MQFFEICIFETATDAPRPMAMAVATDLRQRLPEIAQMACHRRQKHPHR